MPAAATTSHPTMRIYWQVPCVWVCLIKEYASRVTDPTYIYTHTLKWSFTYVYKCVSNGPKGVLWNTIFPPAKYLTDQVIPVGICEITEPPVAGISHSTDLYCKTVSSTLSALPIIWLIRGLMASDKNLANAMSAGLRILPSGVENFFSTWVKCSFLSRKHVYEMELDTYRWYWKQTSVHLCLK